MAGAPLLRTIIRLIMLSVLLLATAKWILKNGKNKTIVIGYDCRFGGKLFSEATAQCDVCQWYKGFSYKEFVSTPMISLASETLQNRQLSE